MIPHKSHHRPQTYQTKRVQAPVSLPPANRVILEPHLNLKPRHSSPTPTMEKSQSPLPLYQRRDSQVRPMERLRYRSIGRYIFVALAFCTLYLYHRRPYQWALGRPNLADPEEVLIVPAQAPASAAAAAAANTAVGTAAPQASSYKVPLTAHIMSKCPDALSCLELLLVPAMEKTVEKVNLTIAYIGTPDPKDDDGVSCMHGPTECLGNILELCAANLYPDPKIYLGFTLCLSKRFPEIPGRGLVNDCALQSGMDFEKLNDCASKDDGAYGMTLLRESVRYSMDVGAKISCTLRLEGETRCVRDGGEWKDCKNGSSVDSFVKDIEGAWESGRKKA